MKREPFLRAPPAILALAGLLVGLHVLRQLVGAETNEALLINFAFIPALFTSHVSATSFLPQWIVSPFSYALIHASWSHLIMNTLWLIAFGSPVAKRLGAWRFALFCLLAAPAGALAHFLSYGQSGLPMIGASAIVSALTAAAVRFVFERDGPLAHRNDEQAVCNPAPPLVENFRNPQALLFVGLWFAVNFLFGAGASLLGPGPQIAWQAHIGGFLAGLVLFSLLDPVKKKRS